MTYQLCDWVRSLTFYIWCVFSTVFIDIRHFDCQLFFSIFNAFIIIFKCVIFHKWINTIFDFEYIFITITSSLMINSLIKSSLLNRNISLLFELDYVTLTFQCTNWYIILALCTCFWANTQCQFDFFA